MWLEWPYNRASAFSYRNIITYSFFAVNRFFHISSLPVFSFISITRYASQFFSFRFSMNSSMQPMFFRPIPYLQRWLAALPLCPSIFVDTFLSLYSSEETQINQNKAYQNKYEKQKGIPEKLLTAVPFLSYLIINTINMSILLTSLTKASWK